MIERFNNSGIPEHAEKAIDKINDTLKDCLPFQDFTAVENQDLIESIMTNCVDLLRFTQSMVNFAKNEKSHDKTHVLVSVHTVPNGGDPDHAIHSAMAQMCDEKHACCEERSCPVNALMTAEEQDENDCPCFKDGKKIAEFLRARG